jgi:hypothetical protein
MRVEDVLGSLPSIIDQVLEVQGILRGKSLDKASWHIISDSVTTGSNPESILLDRFHEYEKTLEFITSHGASEISLTSCLGPIYADVAADEVVNHKIKIVGKLVKAAYADFPVELRDVISMVIYRPPRIFYCKQNGFFLRDLSIDNLVTVDEILGQPAQYREKELHIQGRVILVGGSNNRFFLATSYEDMFENGHYITVSAKVDNIFRRNLPQSTGGRALYDVDVYIWGTIHIASTENEMSMPVLDDVTEIAMEKVCIGPNRYVVHIKTE